MKSNETKTDKSNITLIGMPGSGKSTIGIIIAAKLSLGFIDSDDLIVIDEQKPLQKIINDCDNAHFRKIEELEITKINLNKHIIATGGSVIYSKKAMKHLQKISYIVYLNVKYNELVKRIDNFKDRGISIKKNQTFKDLFKERGVLYKKYADFVLNCKKLNKEEIASEIALKYKFLNV